MAVQDVQTEARLHSETLEELSLTKQPFLEQEDRPPFSDSETQRTRAALEQNVRFGDSLHLLIGEEGAGKTVLLKQLLKHCKISIKPFVAKGSTDFRAEAFLYAVLNSTTKEEKAEGINEYIDKLAPMFQQITDDQRSALMIIDDAHLAPIEEIAELVDTLQHFDTEDGRTARLLLTGTPALKQSIASFEAQFEDLDLSYSTNMVAPLDDERTSEYLNSRLHQAGFADAFPFTDKAVTKIQRESGGLPGRINSSATHYLNGVYRGGESNEKKAGWLPSFEWPVLLVGAAALGVIGIGLAKFLGNEPDATVIPVASTETTEQIEQPVVATTSVNESTGESTLAVTPSNDRLVLPAASTNTEALDTTTETIVATTSTDLVQDQPTTAAIQTNQVQENQVQENQTQAIQVPSPQVNETFVAAEETATQIVNTEPTELAAALNDDTSATVPAPGVISTQDTASNKSVGVSTASGSVAVDTSSIQLPDTTESLAALAGSDSDASAREPIGQSIALEPLEAEINAQAIENRAAENRAAENRAAETLAAAEPVSNGVVVTEPNRAIENERWVLFQSPAKFTVQLATSRERGYIIDLAQTMQVADPVAIYPFLTSNSNNPVFGLLSGLYDTRDEAIAAVEGMSEATKKFGVWIRPVSDLQEDIKRRQ